MNEWKNFASKVTGLTKNDIEQTFHLAVTAGSFKSEPTNEQIAEYEEVRNSACQERCFFVTSKAYSVLD
jgi:hypothetical protein